MANFQGGIPYGSEEDKSEATPLNDRLTALMRAGYVDFAAGNAFAPLYDTLAPHEQVQYEVGRAIGAMLQAKRCLARWEQHEPITALHARIMELGFQARWWSEYIPGGFFAEEGEAAAAAWRAAQPITTT